MLKVLTWNVNCSSGADDKRQTLMANLLINENADIILLNEYNQDLCSVFDSRLKEVYPFTEEEISHQKNGDIFYSKYPLKDSGCISILEEGKEAFLLKATIEKDDRKVSVFGCHLVSNNGNGSIDARRIGFLTNLYKHYKRFRRKRERRCWQACVMGRYVKECTTPVVLMGDMNDFGDSKPLKIFEGCGLSNAWKVGGMGFGFTFHQGLLRLRLDHILFSNEFTLKHVKVIKSGLSDHYPVVACFKI